LRNNKTKKGNQSYVLMLEEAFSKVINKNLDEISYLEQDSNPANLEAIYNTYLILKNRQEMIKPLLPLPIFNKGRNAKFQFRDYSNDIINAKNKLSSYLLTHAQVNSSIDPKLSFVGPEIVPLPIISPALTLQPLTV
ncbi:hypothetical protein JYT50_01020, partial [bacterium AH-315-A23]|nr:hypothetical protein [bacterium AH-315-A23]